MNVLSCDFETYYDKEYGIEETGLYHYLHNDKFDPYLISLWNDDFQWVGNPRDIPWKLVPEVEGFVAWNAAFDRRVFERSVELGIIPINERPKAWWCAANMSVFLGAPRNLKDASKCLLGVELSKEMRHFMRGKTWKDAVAAGKAEQLQQYALDDARYCYEIWKKYEYMWPEAERKTAEITFVQTERGVAVDRSLLDQCIPGVVAAREEALSKIPWAGKIDENGDEIKPLSATAFKKWCKDGGVEVPTTTEAKSPDFKAWQERNVDVRVANAMQIYRSANALTLKSQTLQSQIRADGRYTFNMLYYGATTGRWSAGYEDDRNDSGGLNIQNLIKEPMYGLDLRRAFIAPKGKKFVVSDYSQIEPRCLAWLTNDTKFMDALKAGVPLYEAHARAQGSWTGDQVLKKTNALLYLQKKAEVLALGYGAGWQKFIFMCGMYGATDCLFKPIKGEDRRKFEKYLARTNQQDKIVELKTDVDWQMAVNAWLIVTEFRFSKPQIAGRVGIWKRLENDCRKCHGTKYEIELPSGRVLPYFNVNTIGGLTVSKTMNAAPIKVWGGFLTENLTQAVARDVMRDAIIRLEEAGIMTLFTVHDEIICEVDADFPKEEIKRLMCVVPEWIPGLPIEVEQEETDYYKK